MLKKKVYFSFPTQTIEGGFAQSKKEKSFPPWAIEGGYGEPILQIWREDIDSKFQIK